MLNTGAPARVPVAKAKRDTPRDSPVLVLGHEPWKARALGGMANCAAYNTVLIVGMPGGPAHCPKPKSAVHPPDQRTVRVASDSHGHRLHWLHWLHHCPRWPEPYSGAGRLL